VVMVMPTQANAIRVESSGVVAPDFSLLGHD
jgi:hypothetical protein